MLVINNGWLVQWMRVSNVDNGDQVTVPTSGTLRSVVVTDAGSGHLSWGVTIISRTVIRLYPAANAALAWVIIIGY